jgi:hypothetical protein
MYSYLRELWFISNYEEALWERREKEQKPWLFNQRWEI